MVWRPRSSCGSSKHTKLLFSFPILSPTSSTTSRGSTPSPRSPTQGPIHCSHRSGKIGHKGNVRQSDLIFLTYFVSRYFSGFEAEYLFNRVFLLHTSDSVPSRPQGLRLPFSVLQSCLITFTSYVIISCKSNFVYCLDNLRNILILTLEF